MKRPIDSPASPCLVGKIWKIVYPVFFFHSHWVHHVGKIVFRVRQNEGCMTYFVTSIGSYCCFLATGRFAAI